MTISSGAITSPPVCPWKARMYNKASQEFFQYWIRVLLLPFQIWLIQSISEKVSLPFRNACRSFGPIDFQWTISFTFFDFKMVHQVRDKFRDTGVQLMIFMVVSILAVTSTHSLSWIRMWSSDGLHWDRDWAIGCFARVSSVLPSSLLRSFLVNYLDHSIVTLPRSGLGYDWRRSEFQFRRCQDNTWSWL